MTDENGPGSIKCSPGLRQLYPISGIIFYTIGGGCIIGYPAVLLPQLHLNSSTIKVDEHSESWIASIVGFGILNGILLLPLVMACGGRKLSNLISILPVLAGWGFILVADSVPLLLLGRYLHGIAMGFQGPMAPISIGEYASPKNRGIFMGLISFSLAIGMLICHTCGCYLTWKSTALVNMSFLIVSLIIIITSAETPAWLISKGKTEQCRKSFHRLRGHAKVDLDELEDMIRKQTVQSKNDVNKSKETLITWLRTLINILKKKEFYKPSAIVLTTFMLMQFSGSNIVATYSVTIMKGVAGDTVNPYTGMLIIDITRLIATIVACFSLRRFNVRTVLFSSVIVSTFAVTVTASCIYYRDKGYHLPYSWIPIGFMVVYIFGVTFGIYSIPFMILGEVFPLAYKQLGSLVGGTFLSLTFFIAIKSSPFMFIYIGVHGAFYVFAALTVTKASILYFILPETKGRTLQQIEDYFKGIKSLDVEVSPEEDAMLKHVNLNLAQ